MATNLKKKPFFLSGCVDDYEPLQEDDEILCRAIQKQIKTYKKKSIFLGTDPFCNKESIFWQNKDSIKNTL